MTKLAKILVIPIHKREPATDRRQPIAPQGGHQGGRPAREQRRDRVAPWLLVVMMMGALGLFWAGAFLSRSHEVAGLRTLSAEARRNLVTRTVDELGTICRGSAAATGSLREHCVDQATSSC